LTIPDSETYVPEFGLNVPPEFALNFHELDFTTRREETIEVNLSDALHTPLPRTNEFSLPGYDLSGGPHSIDSGFGDYSGDAGFGYDDEDDDILRNVDDAANLDFNIDTPTNPRKRGAQEDPPTVSKRVRITTSGDDDEIQRIAREDHEGHHQLNDFGDDGGVFGEYNFDAYESPPPPVEETPADKPPRKKRRRVAIVEDNSSTIPDDVFRTWPQMYRETQDVANLQHKKNLKRKFAQKRATQLLWGWGKNLHPSLSDFFSRDALLACWKSPPTAPPDEVEFPMGGFGDGGGFDYSVYHRQSIVDCRKWRLDDMQRMWETIRLSHC